MTAEGTDEFITKLSDLLVDASPEAKADFEEAGFLRAISDTRFMPEEPGAPHTPDAPHVFSFVAQFESDEGAETGLDLIYRDSLRPCPETCATRLDEFDVGDIPEAHGVRRYATAETIAELGEDGEPYDSYEVQFADGQYAYHISFQGGMGDVSQEEVEEIARKLYERVKGAPPPSS